MTEETKILNYYLIAGEVTFVHGLENVECIPTAVRVNGILKTESENFGSYELGNMQRVLQQTFMQRIEGIEEVEILDVVIANIMHIGAFTDEQFAYIPAPITKAEDLLEV